jgi:hypothetical protein
MEKIITAEELIRAQFCDGEFDEIMEHLNNSIEPSIISAMKEFAKLHVKAALKLASEKSKLTNEVCEVLQEHWFEEYIDKDSILNSYSLDNIK